MLNIPITVPCDISILFTDATDAFLISEVVILIVLSLTDISMAIVALFKLNVPELIVTVVVEFETSWSGSTTIVLPELGTVV